MMTSFTPCVLMTLTSLLSVLRKEQPVEFGNPINKSDLPKKFQIFQVDSLVVINKHDRQTERQCLCCHLLLPKNELRHSVVMTP